MISIQLPFAKDFKVEEIRVAIEAMIFTFFMCLG